MFTIPAPYAPCPCASGKKYKFCCRDRDRQRRRETKSKPIVVGDLGEAERLAVEGLRWLERGQGELAKPLLEASIREIPIIPQPHNNLALAHLILGELDEAQARAEHVLEAVDPHNVFTLAFLVHLHLLRDDEVAAQACADRFECLTPPDGPAVLKAAEALARLERYERLRTLGRRWLSIPQDEDTVRSVKHLLGVAEAELGGLEAARRHWEDAVGSAGCLYGEIAQANLQRLERKDPPGTLDGRWPCFDLPDWLQLPTLDRLIEAGRLSEVPGILRSIPEILDGGQAKQDLAMLLLRSVETERSNQLLRQLAYGTFGSDDLRQEALILLVERGEVAEDAPADVYHQGRWKSARGGTFEITTEPVGKPLPPETEAVVVQALEAYRDERLEEAEDLGRHLLELAPELPASHHNLGVVLLALGRKEEARRLFEAAISLDPCYVFARCSLAAMQLDEGDVEGAEVTLQRLELPQQMHLDACTTYLRTHAQLAMKVGEPERALHLLEELAELDPEAVDEDGRMMLRVARAVVELAGKVPRSEAHLAEVLAPGA